MSASDEHDDATATGPSHAAGGHTTGNHPIGSHTTELMRRALVLTSVAAAVVLLLLMLWQALEVLLLTFAGVLVAVLLRVPGDALSRRTLLSERAALTLVLVLLVGLSTVAIVLSGPSLAREVQALSAGMARSVQELEALLRRYEIVAYALDHLPRFSAGDSQQFWQRVGGIGATVIGAFGALSIIVFMGIFFAYNPQLYLQGMVRLVPMARRARAQQVLDALGGTLRWWLLGQLISMLLLWLSTWLVLHLLGVPLAFTLGLLTGLLTFVPYLGPIVALVPIALVAFLESPVTGLLAVGAYLVIQNIEGNVIMPIVFEKTVSIPPALSVASQILMASLLGLLGVLLATPLLAVALVLVKMLYVEDVLGDSTARPVQARRLPNAGGPGPGPP